MPLKLDVKTGDKVVINGAVVENIGGNAKLLVHNESAILREKEVLTEDEAATPAARVYFALQCAYMFPKKEATYLAVFKTYLDDFVAAAPNTREIADQVFQAVDQGKIYKGMKLTQKLVVHEAEVLGAFHEGVRKLLEAESEPGVQEGG